MGRATGERGPQRRQRMNIATANIDHVAHPATLACNHPSAYYDWRLLYTVCMYTFRQSSRAAILLYP